VWQDAQRSARGRLWPEVERFLSELPPESFRQAKLLEYDLALRYSETGQFRDAFLGAGHLPMLSIGSWLLDDLAVSKPGRAGAERHLFLAALFLAGRAHIVDSIPDEGSFYDEGFHDLARRFAEQATAELRAVGPTEPSVSGDGLTAPASLVASTALSFAGRADVGAAVGEMLDELGRAFQLKAELASLHRDLLTGRTSYPIAYVAEVAGIPLAPWPEPEVVLGAMALTGSLGAILEKAAAHARRSLQIADAIGLRAFAAYLEDASATFEAAQPPDSNGARRPNILIRKAEPTLPKALAMARGFLLADPRLEESWEVHREGMFGAPEVTSRFPAAIVLEILAEDALDVGAGIDELLAFTAANRFRYYDHPWADPDTDTIGVFLRLRHFSTTPEWYGHDLEAVLDCLDGAVRSNGVVPVWLRDCRGWEADGPQVLALGEHCGTVVAHLVLGLAMATDDLAKRYRDIAEIGASQVYDRISEVGLRANVNYPPNFALAVFYRLVSRVPTGRAEEARLVLDAELERAYAAGPITPQDAALLTSACRAAGRPELIDPTWGTIILKGQSFDGGWAAEPFAAAPNRGSSVTWYSSRTLTSALCYDALTPSANAPRITPAHALVHA
jgi:hypothetical protein